jgi:integrase
MSLTLKSLINQFVKWADGALAPATVRSYQHHLRRFILVVKNKKVRSLRPVHLTALQRSWHEWQAVQRLFHWAVHEAKLVRSNPFDGVRAPRRGQRKRILTPREIARFLRRSRRSWRNYLLALRDLAARPQEIRALRWEHLHPQNPETPLDVALAAGAAVFVLHEFKDQARRRDSEIPRVLLVTRRLGRLLLRLRCRSSPADGPVFRNTRGLPWTRNAVRCMFRVLRRRLGYRPDDRGEQIVAYTVRHSAATLAAAHGIVDRVLADWLGHVETRTTRRYQHLNVGHIREALLRMNRRSPGRDGRQTGGEPIIPYSI